MAKAHPLIEVRMATTLTSSEQNADSVFAHVGNAAGDPETIEGPYIVSAEGARSVVRKDLGIEFEGFTYPERTLNIEVAYDFKKHGYTERNYISDPVEYSNLFHWKGPPDRWRIHFPTDPNEDEAALTRPEAMQARLKRFLPLDHDYDICGCNLYAVHQRVAKQFRRGRAILAGDSAHVNSPIGGMGLNSGVHDAFNLADKLARILRRRSRGNRARPLRAAAPAHRGEAHPGADHPQQAAARRTRSRGAPAQSRRAAAISRRPRTGAQVPASRVADSKACARPNRSRKSRRAAWYGWLWHWHRSQQRSCSPHAMRRRNGRTGRSG